MVTPIFKLAFDMYYSKKRKYRYEDVEVNVHPEVFPPHFTLSTKILLDYIKGLDINNKSLLELGCGSGIISLYAASKGAIVTASDINQTALNTLEQAALDQNLNISIVYSNLFENLIDSHFEYIIINPPYYPQEPENIKERAWYCGVNFEYFELLFRQLQSVHNTKVYMILSEDCDISKIKLIASNNNLLLLLELEKKTILEKNYIFRIISNENKA